MLKKIAALGLLACALVLPYRADAGVGNIRFVNLTGHNAWITVYEHGFTGWKQRAAFCLIKGQAMERYINGREMKVRSEVKQQGCDSNTISDAYDVNKNLNRSANDLATATVRTHGANAYYIEFKQ